MLRVKVRLLNIRTYVPTSVDNLHYENTNSVIYTFTCTAYVMTFMKINSRFPADQHVPQNQTLTRPRGKFINDSTHVNKQLVCYPFTDKALGRPTSRCISCDRENISFDASLVTYIYIYIYTYIYIHTHTHIYI